MHGVVVEVTGRRFGIPHECPCCGAPPNAEIAVPARASGPTQLFPYCKRCVTHAAAWDSANMMSTATMVLGILAAVLVAALSSVVQGLAVFVAAGVIAWWLRVWRRKAAEQQRVPSCAATGAAVTFHGWSGTTSAFTFESPTFAARFAEDNKRVLANVSPQLQRLIDGYHRARLAVPTPAVAAGVAPPPLTDREWLARLESTEGTLARRVQLQRALEMVEDVLARRELIQAVARIELAPLLGRLQRSASPVAKRQLIEEALAHVRAENIPEELQAAEVQELEARLADAGTSSPSS